MKTRQDAARSAFDAGIAHHRGGRFDLAERCYLDALKHDPGHAHAWHLLGVAHCQRQDYARGIDCIQAAIRIDRQPAFLANLGNALQDAGHLGEALDLYAQALARDPRDPQTHYNRAVALKALKRWSDAVESFHRTLEMTPDHIQAMNGLNTCLYQLERMEEARAVGRRALELKDAGSLNAAHVHSTLARDAKASTATPPSDREWVISFSLFGSLRTYGDGALANVQLARDLFAQWRCRIYCDDSVPPSIVDRLLAEGAQVVTMPGGASLFERLTWRFLVADDPGVGRFICRDCDGRLSRREVAAVSNWIDSGRPFHIMRDSPQHIDLILAGLWGGVTGLLPPMATLLRGYTATKDRYSDQAFLGDTIWPLVKNDALIHDSQFGLFGSRPFPIAEADEPYVGCQYRFKGEDR